ncbi:MAG: asparagine synthase B [Anaerolineales bacterium]|jgi:asparagine synthase (glutamine-hydrolysing)|nr:asparagine synthase B [Anaerolineales bacterium]
MCGICGVFNANSQAEVQSMVQKLNHRGPDGEGLKNLSLGTLGHTRLAIVDVNGGHQPMKADDYWVAFNGEIYNHQNLRQDYLNDESFNTQSDTETLLRLFARFGEKAVSMLDGMFAFALHTPGKFMLARDPLGIKPLYWAEQEGKIYFASEIKALAMFSNNIREFPAGHYYHSELGLHQYYFLGQGIVRVPQNESDAQPMIIDTLREAVHKRLMADVPLGVSLSGGLDSTLVAALAREGLDELHTFAVGMDGSQDIAASNIAAAALDTIHHTLVYTEQDMLKALPDVIYHLESFDPALVRSAIPNYFLAKMTSDHVKVFLTGEGADELFAGYDYLSRYSDPPSLDAELRAITGALHNTNLQRADRMAMAWSLEARVPFLDTQSISLAFSLPAEWKLQSDGRTPKCLLRRACASLIPDEIAWRPKQKFSAGAGSRDVILEHAGQEISDSEFRRERERFANDWGYNLINKEALFYYKMMSDYFSDDQIMPGMGHSRSL